MKAILYAAGRGVRLGAQTPKALIEVGGLTLLERHAVRLRAAGVAEIVVVTGHLREKVAQALPRLRDQHGMEVREIVNPRFEEGSVLSLAASLPEVEGSSEPVLLMDADVLYAGEILNRLIGSRHRTVLLLDRNFSTRDDDPVLVPVKEGRPFEFQKKWNGEAEFIGESVGFFRVAPEDLPMLIAETRARCAIAPCTDSYDEVLRAMVIAGRFEHEEVTGLPWTEIDFPDDLSYARDEVLPAIERLDANSGPNQTGAP
ncbi:MAG: NTP transferase domain-containing protein [Chthoniobacterales bacterium]